MSTKKLQLVENLLPSDPQAGQVLSIDADGNKVWANQYMMDGTLTPGYQYNSALNAHLFVIDVTNGTPDVGTTYYFGSGLVYVKVIKDGVKVSQVSFGSVKQIQLASCTASGDSSGISAYITLINEKQNIIMYFEDHVQVTSGFVNANTWYVTQIAYSSSQVDNLLVNKLDIPTNTDAGTAGQVPVLQEDGTTLWGDMPDVVQSDWSEADETSNSYIKNKPNAILNNETEDLEEQSSKGFLLVNTAEDGHSTEFHTGLRDDLAASYCEYFVDETNKHSSELLTTSSQAVQYNKQTGTVNAETIIGVRSNMPGANGTYEGVTRWNLTANATLSQAVVLSQDKNRSSRIQVESDKAILRAKNGNNLIDANVLADSSTLDITGGSNAISMSASDSGASITGLSAPVNDADAVNKAYVDTATEVATDDEVIDMLIEEDLIAAVSDSDGALLSDENYNILLW